MTSFDQLRDVVHDYPLLWRSLAVLLVLAAARLLARIMRRTLRRTFAHRQATLDPTATADLARAKREQTVLSLLESLVRYVVYGAALVVGLGILTGGATSGLFGASLLVILVGFGAQRLLGDVIAGALLLFEGHYAVGDFVAIASPVAAAGRVEEFSLRTTTLRTLAGDRVVVLNGAITSFVRIANGYREYTIELLVRDDEELQQRLEEVLQRNVASPHQRFLGGPTLRSWASEPGGEVARVELHAAVPPTMEWLAEQSLVTQLERALGDGLLAPVQTFNVAEPAFEAYRSSILVR